MTLSNCDEIIELIPAFVLGALDAHEAAHVATHVAACSRCRAEAESFRDVVGLLPYAAGSLDPPPHVKRQLLARIAAASENAVAYPVQQPQRSTARIFLTGRWFAAALALMLALIVGLGAATFEARGRADQLAAELATSRQMLRAMEAQVAEIRRAAQTVEAQLTATQRELDETRTQLAASQRELQEVRALAGTDVQLVSFIVAPQTVSQLLGTTKHAPKEASARMFMQPGHNRLVLLIYGLKSAEPGKVYRLWLAKGDQAIAIGTVAVGPDGVAEFVVDAPEPMDAYDQVMITLDEVDTAARPSEEVIFEASL
ncbi:MAG: anti-sigma factor [Roseiflexus sp.]|nr:anti-sigma factor [Roseiflexus sp.]MCS7290105.1 anti-sigma factor [Roseiflexus sp.]MDW8231625.1 anti-sigma factor [Roseiflexaceae bacterium]